MFIGEYSPNITQGSRLALPKKLRSELSGDEVILSRGFENCILIYDLKSWEDETSSFNESSITNKQTRELRRYLFGNASKVSLDTQGRVVLPPSLAEWANISNEVIVIGAGDHIEVWNKQVWNEYLQNLSGRIVND